MTKITRIFICLFLTACMVPAQVPVVYAANENVSGAFDEVQLVKGDVYTIQAKNLQRLSITDPNVADISDAKPSQIILVGKAPGQTVLFVWDDSGKRTIIIRVVTEDLMLVKTRIRTLINDAAISGVSIQENTLEGKVVLTGTLPEDQFDRLARIVDPFAGQTINMVSKEEIKDLIQIDMQITELSTTLSKALGVDWPLLSSGSDSTAAVQFQESNLPATGKFQDMFKIGDVNRTTALQAKINAMITEGKGHILSKPRLVVKNGKEATFLVGGEIPIKSITTSGTGNSTTQNTTFKNYGVSLSMTPTIKEGKVDILLNIEISDIDTSNPSGSDIAFVTRSVQTQLYLDDKQTIVLAGLIKKDRGVQVKRIPFLSKIPVLGGLFRSTSTPSPDSDKEVVISLTPTILRQALKGLDMPVVIHPNVVVVPPAPVKVVPEGRSAEKLPVISKNAAMIPVSVPGPLKPYAEAVQQKISSAIAYPYEAQENGWQGTVKLGLVIRKDGSLRDVFVKETSGYDVFDKDAMNTAQILAPYAAFPAGLDQDELTITLPIIYNLDSFLKNVAKRK